MKTLKESYSFTSENGDKSFNELYKGQDYLFEDTDTLIDPRMAKLFESVYQQSKRSRLREKKGAN